VYYWRVRAYNSLGQPGDWSATWVISIKLTPATLVFPDANSDLKTLRPTFVWSDVANTGYYTIQVSKNDSFTKIVLDETPTTPAFTPEEDLPSNQVLYWRVRAEGSGGSSSWSPSQSFTTPNPPGIPILLSPNAQATLTEYRPLFKWNPGTLPRGTQFDHYQIQVSANQDFSSLSVDENLPSQSTTIFTPVTDLAAHSKYYWRMRAYNTSNEISSWSNVRTFVTPNLLAVSERPGIASFDANISSPTMIAPSNETTIYTSHPRLDWVDIPGATSYIVQVSLDPTFASSVFVVSATIVDSNYTFISEAPPDSTFYWRILTINENKVSNWSPTYSFDTP
jgi:hypothetical protein